jgi:hypothetical protein
VLHAQTCPSAAARVRRLSVDEKIDYLQSLWDRIAATPETIPVPEWHREILDDTGLRSAFRAGELDEVGRTELKRQLAQSPDNLELRIKRLGFLFAKELPRASEVLWLATQHPSIDLGGFSRPWGHKTRSLMDT